MNDFFLADDLSGALDAAAAFHYAGRRVRIVLSSEAARAAPDEVIGLTTETRNAPPEVAAMTVARVLAEARAGGGRLRYKKIDSTMRGPVAAELAALAAAMPETRILFAPANPAAGRTVRDGVLRVHGVPVAETEFARDPANPVRESTVRALLGAAATERVVIADAETQEDLEAAARNMESAGAPWVAVGSGALARAVVRDETRFSAERTQWPEIPAGAGLMICGSAHPVNRVQAERLRRERDVPLHELSVANSAAAVNAAVAGLAAGRGAALLIDPVRVESGVALRTITATAVAVVAATGVRRVFITGGETAFALCGALGISTLIFLDEIEPGVSLARAETARGPMLLAVKPGGFGDEATWVRVWDRSGRTPGNGPSAK